jgi:hypothetical protein
MAKEIGKCKCANCGIFFPPDHRNRRRQKYCKKTECRKAAKAASQKRWLEKPENRDYFCGPENMRRVQEWRKAHPGYSRKRTVALQDRLPGQALENTEVKPSFAQTQPPFASALQDLLACQPAIFIGLIAQLTGSVLQDDIARTTRRLQELGSDILNDLIQNTGGIHDQKTSNLPAARAPDT